MATGVPYLGSKISLISKSEIRYEGILYTLDSKESTVALAKVRSFGTEDRPTDRPVAPRDEIYEYIIFRGSDIKDIRVCAAPKPQPTLEGGLPNDPAIVQHSAGNFPVSGMPPSQGFGGAPGPNVPKPGAGPPFGGASSSGFANAPSTTAFSSGASARPNDSSPVMDLFRQEAPSGGSSPFGTARTGSRPESSAMSPQNQEQGQRRGGGRPQRGHEQHQRGAAPGFQRGGRGRGGPGGYPMRGGQQRGVSNPRYGGNRNEGRTPSGNAATSGFQPGRPTSTKKEPLKFDNDYDFDKANEEFKEFCTQFEKANVDGSNKDEAKNGDAAEPSTEDGAHHENAEDGEIPEHDKDEEPFYDKAKSFFDNISCEALERSKGNMNRPDWKAEKKLNRETFGATGNFGGGRNRGYYGRGGGQRGTGYNRGRGGGYGGYGYGGYSRGGYGGGGYNNAGGYNNGYGGGGYNNAPREYNSGSRDYNNGGGYNNGRFSRENTSTGGGYRGRGANSGGNQGPWNQPRGGGMGRGGFIFGGQRGRPWGDTRAH